jgi:polar amino acid transport system substrate-binding protein
MRVAVELVHSALQRSGVPAQSEIRGDFAQLMEDLREGRLDGSPALWRDEEREKYLLFSHPYLENRLVLLARRGTDVSVGSLAELKGQRVGVVEGYSYGAGVDGVPGPILVRGESDQDNVDRLVAGDLDYVLADELLVHELFERHGDKARELLVAGSAPILHRSLHFALRRDLAGAAEIVERFDAAIRAMIADGSYNRILGLQWILADLDGDGTAELVLGGGQAGTRAPQAGYSIFRPGKEGGPKEPTAYVVDGKKYQAWEQIPTEYRVPVDTESEPPRPGLRLFEF